MISVRNLTNNQPAGGSLNDAVHEPTADDRAAALLNALSSNRPARIKIGVRTAPDNCVTEMLAIDKCLVFVKKFAGGRFFTCATWRGGQIDNEVEELLAVAVACPFATPEQEAAARLALMAFEIPPNALIPTDGKLYALWFLHNRLNLINEQYRSQAERTQQLLAAALDAETLAPDDWIPLPGDEGIEPELFDKVPRCDIGDLEFAASGIEEDNQQANAVSDIKPGLATSQPDKQRLEIHPVAEAFPPMLGEAFAKLVESIKANGLRQAIILAPDAVTIVDGLNRWLACLEAGVEPRFETLPASYDALAILRYIIDANLNRRDLSDDQRAFIAAETIEPALKAAAKERQRAHAGTAPGRPSTLVMNSAQVNGTRAPTSREQAAKEAKVSPDRAAKAQRIVEHAPELKAKVIAGELSMHAANRAARQRAAGHDDPVSATTTKFIRVSKAVSPLAGWWWEPLTAGEDESLVFHAEQLIAPATTWHTNATYTDPRMGRVLICPSADLYDPAVSDEAIRRVHAACTKTPTWQYLFVSKFPERIAAREDLPRTAWIGVSVRAQEDVAPAQGVLRKITNVSVKWLSVSPREEVKFADLSVADWLVVNAPAEAFEPGEQIDEVFTPSFNWLAKLYIQARNAGCGVFFTLNLLNRLELPREEPNSQTAKK